jgi:glycine oxidase
MVQPANRTSSLRIAVVGAGAIGLGCALRLKQAGAEVAVYERGSDIGAGVSQRAAGMLSAAFESALDAENPALVVFAQHASRLWADFASEIERLGGGGVEYATEGSLVCTTQGDEQIRELAAACQARGISARLLTGVEARSVEPALSGQVRSALLLPDDRQVEAPLVLQRLRATLQRVGVGVRFGRSVERIVAAAGGVFVLPDGEKFDRVLLATGAGPQALRFFDRFGEELPTGMAPVAPVKGQMLALAPFAGAPRHVIRMGHAYIAPKQRWILVGATVERGRSDTIVDREAISALRTRAARFVSAIAEAPEVSSWAGVRPGTPDDAPMIGSTSIAGVHAALGCYRNGILFAPAVAELVVSQMLDGKVSAEARAFWPLRFDKNLQAPHSR